ncbi:MAG: hypothetical protein WBQ72_04725 [Terriglobales bacterium]
MAANSAAEMRATNFAAARVASHPADEGRATFFRPADVTRTRAQHFFSGELRM